MARDDGGPAFPRPYSTNGTAEDGPDEGMSLRDYFAIHANLADVQRYRHAEFPNTDIRTEEEARYAFADAMLSARGGADNG